VHTDVVELVTDFTPSPVVETVGVKDPPKTAEPGTFGIEGAVGDNFPIVNDCGEPSAAPYVAPTNTRAVRVQVPAAR
jgi:hypothetical protein